jgi:hypothetical protein
MKTLHDRRPVARGHLHDRRQWAGDRSLDQQPEVRDRLQSGAILLAMAALAWTMTTLPAYIVYLLAIVGYVLILAGLDALAGSDEGDD